MNSRVRYERCAEAGSARQDALVIGGSRRCPCDRSISSPPERSALNPHDGHRHIRPSSGPTEARACSGVVHFGQSAPKTESKFDGCTSTSFLLPNSPRLQSFQMRAGT